MVPAIRKKIDRVELLAKQDPESNRMLGEIRLLERKYNAALKNLSAEQMDDVCDFVSMCEDMSWRMLELACEHMVFPADDR